MNDSEINLRIQRLIKEKGYTIYQLSKESFIPQSTLYDIMHDKNIPSIHTLMHICKFLNITMGEFFSEPSPGSQPALTPAEEKHISLYRNIPVNLQNHIDNYLSVLAGNLADQQPDN